MEKRLLVGLYGQPEIGIHLGELCVLTRIY